MRKYKYTGLFRSSTGHEYELSVTCDNFMQALILLTADAIRSGRHYQLAHIESDTGERRRCYELARLENIIGCSYIPNSPNEEGVVTYRLDQRSNVLG